MFLRVGGVERGTWKLLFLYVILCQKMTKTWEKTSRYTVYSDYMVVISIVILDI